MPLRETLLRFQNLFSGSMFKSKSWIQGIVLSIDCRFRYCFRLRIWPFVRLSVTKVDYTKTTAVLLFHLESGPCGSLNLLYRKRQLELRPVAWKVGIGRRGLRWHCQSCRVSKCTGTQIARPICEMLTVLETYVQGLKWHAGWLRELLGWKLLLNMKTLPIILIYGAIWNPHTSTIWFPSRSLMWIAAS